MRSRAIALATPAPHDKCFAFQDNSTVIAVSPVAAQTKLTYRWWVIGYAYGNESDTHQTKLIGYQDVTELTNEFRKLSLNNNLIG